MHCMCAEKNTGILGDIAPSIYFLDITRRVDTDTTHPSCSLAATEFSES